MDLFKQLLDEAAERHFSSMEDAGLPADCPISEIPIL